jgi:hypothetical protein
MANNAKKRLKTLSSSIPWPPIAKTSTNYITGNMANSSTTEAPLPVEIIQHPENEVILSVAIYHPQKLKKSQVIKVN